MVNFNPHLHVLAADGAFLPNGRFVALPRVPANLLAEGFRRAVLDFLVKNEALSKELRARMLAWRHGGFSAHNEVSKRIDHPLGHPRNPMSRARLEEKFGLLAEPWLTPAQIDQVQAAVWALEDIESVGELTAMLKSNKAG